MSRLIFTLVVVVTVLLACKKDNVPTDLHTGYFPMEQGRFITYFVREIVVNADLKKRDTSTYYLKTLIGDTIIDNQGRTARRFERYVRSTLQKPWVLKDVWTTFLNGNRLELVEENQRVIKLVFAPTVEKTWNANAFNTNSELECNYRDIHQPQKVNGINFDKTLVVEQEKYFTLIDYKRKFEVYAEGVGLVYKHFKDTKIAGFDTNAISTGVEQTMRVLEYGIE